MYDEAIKVEVCDFSLPDKCNNGEGYNAIGFEGCMVCTMTKLAMELRHIRIACGSRKYRGVKRTKKGRG
jgi:hypothetical protein